MEHCYLSTTIYCDNGQTIWCKSQNNQVHSKLNPCPREAKHLTKTVIFVSMSSDELYSSTVNLALKGIVGLYAMGEINRILEARGADTSKSSYYLVSYIIQFTVLTEWLYRRRQIPMQRIG